MKKFIPLTSIGMCFLLLHSTLVHANECRLAGTWKSNEEKTLQNMKSAHLTEKQRKLFSSGFFGKLVINITCSGFTTTYEGSVQTYQFISMQESGDSITTKYFDPVLKKEITSVTHINEGCYSEPVGRLGFDEVFCRVK